MTEPVHVDGETRIYAIWGDPVAQVQTPRLINPIFAEAGENIVAVPFHVRPQAFDDTWRAFMQMSNIVGIGVTVPHKVAAARICDDLTAAARDVGAANSIQRLPDGTMRGALFDGIGFLKGLGPNRARIRGGDVLLLGAGGAGRAIAHALAEDGVGRVRVLDRDPEAVAYTVELVNRVAGAAIAAAADDRAADAEIWINATPVGLKPGDILPVDLDAVTPDKLIADIASLSRQTELLKRAQKLGCAVSNGGDMLGAQIALIAGFAAGLAAGETLG